MITHNKNEEIEHAMMNLEWIRRHSPVFDTNIETYVDTTGPHHGSREGAESGGRSALVRVTRLGIGSLKGSK